MREEPSKVPPQAPELEQAVLGAMMLERRAQNEVLDILRPDSFYVHAHERIYAAIAHLATANGPINILTVTEELRKRGDLDVVGGAFYISQLTNKVASSANVEYHARIVSQKHALRDLIAVSGRLQQDAYGDSIDVFDLLHGARSSLDAVTTRLLSGSGSMDASQGVGALADSTPMPPGYLAGISALDDAMPFQPGLPYVFAGRPGIGKSIMSCVIAWHMTACGDALLFSPEMTLRQIQSRIISMECGVPYSTILARRMDEQQVTTVAECAMRIADRLKRLHVDITSAITPDQMRVRVDRASSELDIKGFVIDHLHKMSTGDRRVDKDETPRVSQCMEGITRVAKDSEKYAVVMCQLNRLVEARPDRRPRLSDLKQTGRIEEDAAGVVLLFRQGYYEAVQPWEDDMEMAIAKNRDGACSIVTARCVPALNRILN